ncbi:Ig-like domain repeat protein [Methanobrevibacter sp.]|uniref:Ig-like domain-containing protein n=1 Tax=Methanobrevibacter sp. TaxID=66852 RepID=UPI00388D123D
MNKIAILLICVLALFAVSSTFAAQQPQINVHVDNIKVGETAHVQITLPADATGVVTVSVDGHNQKANIVDGKATVNLNGLNEGKHTIKVKYHGEGNYSDASAQSSLEVTNPAPSKNNTPGNASGEPVNNTPVKNNTNVTPKNNTNMTPKNNTNVTPKNNTNMTPKNNTNVTPANKGNASGEPTNATPIVINNVTNITNNTNNTNNTNTTNVTNNSTNNLVVPNTNKHPPKKPPKPKNPGLHFKNTGLPIAVAIVVIIGIVGGVIYKKR